MFNEKSLADVVKEASRIVSEIAGIQLGPKQFPMVENRLKTRMSKLGIDSYEVYLKYLKEHEDSETQALLSLLTTHHTYFFREFSHFEFILNDHLKNLVTEAERRGDNKIRVWSAACSRGQEVYSIAMFLDFHLSSIAPHIDFEVYGSDVDSESIHLANNGVYKSEDVHQSPAMYVADHWVQGKGDVKDYSKVKSNLKNKCRFFSQNLLQANELFTPSPFDIIFCRNVFIYFNSDQVQKITGLLNDKLQKHGLLILGLSESLHGLDLPLEATGPSIYQKASFLKEKKDIAKRKMQSAIPSVSPAPVLPLNILCIDDSPTIHTLMKNILTTEHGFIIKNKSMNGEEALKLLETETYDAITLDLHMPKVDGLSFLKKRKDTTPVIVVSSVNREDMSIAQQALKLGAFDYVEKPSIENLINSGNEIRSKLKMAVKFKKGNTAPPPKTTNKIRTLIVDDSETIRNLLEKILQQDEAFEVVGKASDSYEADQFLKNNRPDLITLDIHMPKKDGITYLREVQQKQFIPTVMISSLSNEDGPFVMEALAAGAIDYIQKPEMSQLKDLSPIIRERLKVAAKAKKSQSTKNRKILIQQELDKDHLILLGASTGGTEAISQILDTLPNEIPPILIVQHIPPVFSKAFAERLNSRVSFEVKEAEHGESVTPNKVLIAPGGKHMGLKRHGKELIVQITDDAPVNRYRPSVDYLFKSAADIKLTNATAVILTGMGDDGSNELKRLKENNLNIIAQDEATSVVFGMPKEAIATGVVDYILPIQNIAEKIFSLSADRGRKKVS